MLHRFSKSSLIWTVSALTLLGLRSSPLSAQIISLTSNKSATPKVSVGKTVAKAAVPATPRVDITSLSSVEHFIAFLRGEAQKGQRGQSKTEKEREEAKEEREKNHQSQLAKGVKKSALKLTRAQLKKFGGEDGEDEARTEAWDSYLYWLRPRVYPGNTLDVGALSRAATARDKMPASSTAGGRVPVPQSVTPKAVTPKAAVAWSTFGPPGYAGGSISWRVTGLTYDPNDPTHYFAAGSRGGVWESKDSGQTWTPIMDFMPMLPVSCIAVDYRDSNTIYIGTGEYDSPGPGYGILKGRWDGTKWSFTVLANDIIGGTPVHRITVDPNTSSKIFATAGNKGLLVSIDRGTTWKVALGPTTNPAVTGSFSNVIYNSFGDRIWACADGPGGGVFESKNGGVTWAALSAPVPASRIDIAASPVRSPRGRATLYALYASEQMVMKGSPAPLAPNAPIPDDSDGLINNATVPVFVACANFPKTAPGARNIWDQSTFYNMCIACSTTNDRVTVTDNANPPHIGTTTRDVVIVSLLDLHISLDSGQLWRSGIQQDIDFPYNGLPPGRVSGTSGIRYETIQQVSQFHTDQHALAINPKNPFEFLAGCDGGAYRISFTPGPEPGGPARGIHFQIPEPIPNPLPTPPAPPGPPDPHDYALYESQFNIFDHFFGSNPYNSPPDFDKPLGNYNIAAINGNGQIVGGLGIAQFYFTGHHPSDPLTAIGGTQDNGTQFSFGTPVGWQDVIGGDGGGCGINQFNPNIQFGSLNFKNPSPIDEPFYPVVRTEAAWQDGGFDVTLFTGDDITAFFSTAEMSRSNPNLYYMSTNYLYQFDERVGDWVKLAQQFSSLNTVSAIETSSSSTKYLYVGTNDGFLYFSSNADSDPGPDQNLVTFTRIDRQGLVNGLPQRSITGIGACATNPKQIYVTLSGLGAGHVFVCYDITGVATGGTVRWQNITGSLPDIFTNCIAVLPRNNGQEMAVGTDVGVFYTADSGSTWLNITAPFQLPNVQVNKLYYTPVTKFLNAGTFGRGMWHIDLTNPLSTVGSGTGGIPPPPLVTIAPFLQSYGGDRTKLAMTVDVFQGGANILSKTVQLSAGGFGTVTLPSIGTYDIRITIPGFLHKRLTNQVINKNIQVTPILVNGDVVRDNMITLQDLQTAQAKLGQFTTGPGDVDGDGRVTSNDIKIITNNLGQVGDQ